MLLELKSPETNGLGRKGTSLVQGPTQSSQTRKIAFLGDYLPRKCGIATFTTDLRCAVAAKIPMTQCPVVPVNDLAAGYNYPGEVRFGHVLMAESKRAGAADAPTRPSSSAAPALSHPL